MEIQNLSLAQLEAVTGISKRTWSRWFNGQFASMRLVKKAAEALEISEANVINSIEREATKNARAKCSSVDRSP